MLLSRKRLNRIKKTKEQSRRRRKYRNKKKYRRRRKGGSKKRKRALNLRKRTMKVYKGGFRRPNFSFVYPTPDNTKLSIVTMKPNANDVQRQMFVTLTLHPKWAVGYSSIGRGEPERSTANKIIKQLDTVCNQESSETDIFKCTQLDIDKFLDSDTLRKLNERLFNEQQNESYANQEAFNAKIISNLNKMKSGITVLGNPEGKDALASDDDDDVVLFDADCPPGTTIHPDPNVRRSDDGSPVCLTDEQLAVYNERNPSEEEGRGEEDVFIGDIFDENEPRLPNDLITHCRKYNTGKSGNLTGQNYIGPEGSSGPIRKRRKKAITSCRMDKICRTIAGKNDGGHKDPSKRKCVIDSSKSNAALIAAFEELNRACRGEDCPPVEGKIHSDDEDEVLVPPVLPLEGKSEAKTERNDDCPPGTKIHPDPAVLRSDGTPVCLTDEQLAVYNERHPSEEEVRKREEGDVSIGDIFDGEDEGEGDEVPVPPVEGKRDGDEVPVPPVEGKRDGDDVPVPPVEGKRDGDDVPAVDLDFRYETQVVEIFNAPNMLWKAYMSSYREGDMEMRLSYSRPVQVVNFISNLSRVDNKINRLNAWEFLYTKLYDSANVMKQTYLELKEKYNLPEETLIDFLNNMKNELKKPTEEESQQRYSSLITKRLRDPNNQDRPIIIPGFSAILRVIHDNGRVEIITIFVESIVINKSNDTAKPNYREIIRDKIVISPTDSSYNSEFFPLIDEHTEGTLDLLNHIFGEEGEEGRTDSVREQKGDNDDSSIAADYWRTIPIKLEVGDILKVAILQPNIQKDNNPVTLLMG